MGLDARNPDDWPGLLVKREQDYCLALQVLVAVSHIPPALSQSAFVLAMVTSPAKADAANATPRASASVSAIVLMGFLPVLIQRNFNSAGLGEVATNVGPRRVPAR